MKPGGYVWWYVDGLSEDGRHALSVIVFIGSVFSPYYWFDGRRRPENHCAFNVALYGPGASRWTMTERGAGAVRRDAASLTIGPSSIAWDGEKLTLEIDEIAVPFPRRVKGRIVLRPHGLGDRAFSIDGAGRHRWCPVAAHSAIEVAFDAPDLRWRGAGYFDTNAGDETFGAAFTRWDWSRADLGDRSAVLYDIDELDGTNRQIAVAFDASGRGTDFEPPPRVRLPGTFWRIGRQTQAEDGAARVVRTLEDTPFYARSELSTKLLGVTGPAVHESLDVTRFDRPIVKAMLPFRMPRRSR